jgi:membrane-associated phospholipid phosphatase
MTDHGPVSRSGPLGRTTPGASDPRTLSRKTALLALGLACLVGCLLILGTLASEVQAQEANALDAMATPFLHGLASPALDLVMNGASFIGSEPVVLALALAAIGLLAAKGRRREALFVGAALGGSLVANGAMKVFFHRPRPALAWAHVLPDYSFPSGHSMDSLVFLIALALVIWRILGVRPGVAAIVVASALSLVIGISRIYLGYHYLTDVVGGFAAGILWLAVVVGAFRGGSAWQGRRARGASRSGAT